MRENRDRVVQVEIVCSCDRMFAQKYGYVYVANLDGRALQDLGKFIRFMHDHYGVPLVAAGRWLPYPQSYGNSAARMSGPEYDRFSGVLGHQHASGNTHGDPGAINIDAIMIHAKAGVAPPPKPPTPPEENVSTVVTYYGASRGRVIDFASRTVVGCSRDGALQIARGLARPWWPSQASTLTPSPPRSPVRSRWISTNQTPRSSKAQGPSAACPAARWRKSQTRRCPNEDRPSSPSPPPPPASAVPAQP